MIRSFACDNLVSRQRQMPALQFFLQERLRVFYRLDVEKLDTRFKHFANQRSRSFNATVHTHRANDRFHGIFEYGCALAATTPAFAQTQLQELTKLERRTDHRERLTAHKFGTHQCQHVFVKMWSTFIENLSDDVAQNGIAEKFKTLIVIFGKTLMGQRLCEKRAVTKFVGKNSFQAGKRVRLNDTRSAR